jgi:hypothetical protein
MVPESTVASVLTGTARGTNASRARECHIPTRKSPVRIRPGLTCARLVTVQILQRAFSVPTIPAFALAAIFPLASVLVVWAKSRRIEWIGLGVLVSLAFGVAMAFCTEQAGFAALKGAPAFGLFGLASLASVGSRKPLMFFVARTFETQGDPAKIAAWNARLAEPRFYAFMQRLSLVWGVACLTQAILGTAAEFLLPPSLALVIEPTLAIITIASLLAWTYSRRPRAEASTVANPS